MGERGRGKGKRDFTGPLGWLTDPSILFLARHLICSVKLLCEIHRAAGRRRKRGKRRGKRNRGR